MISYENIRKNEAVNAYIKAADASLLALGYTEHSFAHVGRVVEVASQILVKLGYDHHTVELAKIAAYMHDIGNLVNRIDHSQSGAVMAFRILDNLGMPPEDIATVVTAIGNHDEGTGIPVNPVAAALIIADKSDVRRTRVRNSDPESFDIHDRVNYSAELSSLTVDEKAKEITLALTVDTRISSVMEYFEIFLTRMKLCKKSADSLGLKFRLVINGQHLI